MEFVILGVCSAIAFIMGRAYELGRQRRIVGSLIDQNNLTREEWEQLNAGL
jgi:hypothetical protein